MEKINFSTNVPVEVALQTLEGKPKESNFGGVQHMFFTTDGRVFYVSETVGTIINSQLKKQAVQVGEPVEIVKAEVSAGNGRKTIQWKVSRIGFVPGEQGDGTFGVEAPPPRGDAREFAKWAKENGAGVVAPAPAAPNERPVTAAGSHSNEVNGTSNRGPFVKIPLNLAVIDAVRMVQFAMRETGEQWSDGARQDLVSTILITAQREGWVSPWRLPAAPEEKAS
jgi:hypothetical protein